MTCKNCARVLAESDGYCSGCGGKVIHNRLTPRNLFYHINETYFNYNNKLLRTFLNLFGRPEDVINGYIGGVRKKYVDVVSYFALAITLSGLQIYVLSKLDMDLTMYDTSTETGRQQQKIFEGTYKFTTEYQSLIMMLYIPFYALLAQLVFRRYRKFNYTEHLVVFMYAQAQVSILTALVLPLAAAFGSFSFGIWGYLILIFQFIYYTYLLKRVYALTAGQMFRRTLVFLVVLSVVFIIFSIAAAFVMYRMGMFEKGG